MTVKVMVKKVKRVFKEEGIFMLARKSFMYMKNSILLGGIDVDEEMASKYYMDVLFVNGCYLDHPHRYRVSHQREQLAAADVSNAEIFYTDVNLKLLNNFRMIILYRCPYTEELGAFVERAKALNKKVYYDIDDLVIDKRYTDHIKYIQTMKSVEREIYDAGVMANGKLLSMCDGAITTTEALADELKQYVDEVYINRNTASEKMIELSVNAQKKKASNNTEKVVLGYFSGSITHNPDFNMILPALGRLFKEYQQLELLVVGELELPRELSGFADRVVSKPMVKWTELPDLIASVDINLAPLEDSLFNRAKSENKWLEAALVKVPTVASNVGAFAHIIEDGKTGILCENTEGEWHNKLKALIDDSRQRSTIAEQAYKVAYYEHTTIYRSYEFGEYIRNHMAPNIVWLLPVMQISGGAMVVLKHAAFLQRIGVDVSIFNFGYETTEEIEQDGCLIPILSMQTGLKKQKVRATIDKCVATLWSTYDFFEVYGKIKNRYYFVQNYETDFYQPGETFRIRANKTYCSALPVQAITISRWCENWLREKYHTEARFAPNGIDTKIFYSIPRDYSGKIRILIEGNSEDYYKNVDESFKIVEKLDSDKYEIWYMSYLGKPKDWYRVDKFFHKVPYTQVADIYRQCHILLKSSLLESFSYPPLEMMSTGGCVVVAPNGGNIEYLRDRENCLLYQPGSYQDAIACIEEITCDKDMREQLIAGGIATGQTRAWENVRKQIIDLYN